MGLLKISLTLFSGIVVAVFLPNAYAGQDEVIPIVEGSLCSTSQMFRPSGKDSAEFYECTPLTPKEREIYKLTDAGIWTKRSCPDNSEFEFDELRQRCENKKNKRRQQAACNLSPNSVGCSQPCQASNANPMNGNQCSWMTAPLQADQSSPTNFMQCAPQAPGNTCGQWVRMPCAPGTQFDQRIQVCVRIDVQQQQGSCGQQQVPVCGCAQPQQAQQQCPGTSSCQAQTCCQPSQQPYIPQPQPYQPQPQPYQPQPQPYQPQPQPYQPQPQPYQPQQQTLCPGTNAQPACSCDQGCPAQTSCQPNVGCCPQQYQPQPTQIYCPATTTVPVSPCSQGCPAQTACQPNIGCCPQVQPIPQPTIYEPQPYPQVQPIPQPIPYQPQPYQIAQSLCANTNSPPVCSCQQGCPQQTQCQQNVGCCPQTQQPSYPQPQPYQPQPQPQPYQPQPQPYQPQPQPYQPQQQLCSGTNQQPVCSCNQGCPAQTQCQQNVGCCPQQPQPQPYQPQPQPYIPEPQPYVPQPQPQPQIQCPSGGYPSQPCSANTPCPQGQGCYQGGCCPMQCPKNYEPIGFCQQGQQQCQQGSSCNQGCCCQQQMPNCPNGQIASSTCNSAGSCGPGQGCMNGGCCPLPSCPNGQPATQQCSAGGSCPIGQQCQSGVCCNQPTCPTGQLAVSSCSTGFFGSSDCPSGYSCQQSPGGSGCCPQPLPTCPNQMPALQSCSSGTVCPTGYGCTNTGGCCQLATSSSCPVAQQPTCQCASNNICPQASSCNQGMCCASAQTPLYGGQTPGMPCSQSSQCNGYSSGCSSCQENSCACQGGAYSNGVTCQQQPAQTYTQAATGCSQYGGGCRLKFNKLKRKPVLEDDFSEETEPLWWRPQANIVRRCPKKAINGSDPDATCTPEEFCWEGICVSKKWPGEFGCRVHEECKIRCAQSYCEKDTEEGIGQCRCKNGFALFGLCFSKCPEGTSKDGALCKIINMSEEFWINPERQRRLEKEQRCGKTLAFARR